MRSSDIGLAVFFEWPPKSLRSQEVALGRKRLCTTGIGPSWWLVPLSEMAFLSNCALFHVIFRARFIVSLRPSFLPRPGLGVLLSSYLKGRYINSIHTYIDRT